MAQQMASQNPGPEPTAPINTPDQGMPAAMPQQAQPQVKGPSPWQRAVHALLGSQTEYNQTPNGPVPVQVQNKPGQLFRSILAGAILGAGAGTANAEHSAGSGWNAAGAGASAVQKNDQQQQQQKQQQAQQQFENQRQVNQDQQEEIRRKAEIALNNAQTLRINKELQGSDFDQHVKVANIGRASVQPFEDAGINPVASNISESQMHQYIQDHPEATNYDWEPVSVKTVMTKDKDGNEVPSYESVYSAYDPKGKVTIPASTISEWKKAGVFDRYPEYEAALSNNKTLPASVYVQVKGDANKVIADNLAKQNQTLETSLKTQQIEEVKARTKQALASAYNENMSAQEKKDNKNKQASLDTAWDHLAKAGNDPSKPPMTAEDRVTIARNAQPLIQDSLNAIKVAANDPSQQDQLPELWNNYHSLSRLAQLGGSDNAGQTVPYVDSATGTQYNLPPDKVADFLKQHPNAKKVGEAAGPTNPLDTMTSDTAMIKNASGATTAIAKSSLDSFLKLHPEYTLVGYGTKPAAAAPSETQPAAQPNNYQGR